MTVPVRTVRRRPENLLPMINIVFLMLIFFMTAGALESADPFRVDPPRVSDAEPANRAPDVLLLDRQGRLALAGVEIEPAALGPALADWLRDHPEGLLRLKADGQVPARTVVELLEQLRDAGVARLLLLSLEPAS